MKGSIPVEEKTFTLDGLSIDSDFSGTMEIVGGEIVFHGSNAEWAEFLGSSVEEVQNKPFLNFVSPQDLNIAQETINNIMEGRNVKDISLNLVTNEGSFSKIAFSALTKGNTWFWFAKKAFGK